MKRLLGTLLVVTLTAGSLAACAKKDAGATAAGQNSGPSGGAGFNEGPGSGSSGAANGGSGAGAGGDTGQGGAGKTGDPGQNNGGQQQQPAYPGDAKGYCQVAVDAWVKGDTGRIKQLAGAGAASNFQYIDKGADTGWKYAKQDGKMCVLRNNHGDELQVTVDSNNLGKPQAVTDVVIEKTEYASNPSDYVSSFMYAWFNGNTQRMAIYSSGSIAGAYAGKKAPPNWTEGQQKEDKGDSWLVHESSNGGGSYTFKVSKNLGKANGILGIS